MKLAIIGTGHVGRTVGRRWVEVGHDVTFGVRSTNNSQAIPVHYQRPES